MSHGLPHEFLSSLRTSRIEALSDGIFAISMTLLILLVAAIPFSAYIVVPHFFSRHRRQRT